MLAVGVPGINAVEERSVFSLWAISAAPLWAGNDLTIMSPWTQQILTNREVIAVDQDPLGTPATLVGGGNRGTTNMGTTAGRK